MKRNIIIAVSALVGIIVILLCFFLFFQKSPYSVDQQNLIRVLGNPRQFVIMYLPRSGGKELVRNEIWLYPDAGKQIRFYGGQIVTIDPYIASVKAEDTKLMPGDFDFTQTKEDVAAILGGEVEEADLLEDTEARVFYSASAVFIVESDHVTFFQTLGHGDKSFLVQWENAEDLKLTPTPTPVLSPTVSLAPSAEATETPGIASEGAQPQ